MRQAKSKEELSVEKPQIVLTSSAAANYLEKISNHFLKIVIAKNEFDPLLNQKSKIFILCAEEYLQYKAKLRLNHKLQSLILVKDHLPEGLETRSHMISYDLAEGVNGLIEKILERAKIKDDVRAKMYHLQGEVKKLKLKIDTTSAELKQATAISNSISISATAKEKEELGIVRVLEWVLPSSDVAAFIEKIMQSLKRQLDIKDAILLQIDNGEMNLYTKDGVLTNVTQVDIANIKSLQNRLADLWQRPILSLYVYELETGLYLVFEAMQTSTIEDHLNQWWQNHSYGLHLGIKYIFQQQAFLSSIKIWQRTFYTFKEALILFTAEDLIEANSEFLKCFDDSFADPKKLIKILDKSSLSYKDTDFRVNRYSLDLVSGHKAYLLHFVNTEDSEGVFTDWLQASKMSSIASLAGSIAHEINNPLSGIKISAEHLLLNKSEASADIQEIYEASKRALKIVSGFKNFSSSKMEDMYHFPVLDLIQSSVSLCKAITTNINIKLDLGSEIYILGNFELLQQVFFNLISNSAEAMQGKGNILIHAEHYSEGQVQVVIEDNGPGIADKDRENIFKPFFTTKNQMGTGLGLNICKRIISLHQGEIHLDTSYQLGSRFVLRFKK